MEIPWSELEEKSKKLLTAAGRINMRSPEAPRQLFLEEVRIYIPWVEDLSQALWCISERKIELPLCKYCSSPALFIRKERKFREYCSSCKDKYIAEKREQTMIEKYGVKNASNLDSRKEVMERVNQIRREKFASGELQSWMKGKTKETDERVLELSKKMSETKKKKYASGETQSWIKGLTKETDERVAKLGEKVKESWVGRDLSESQLEVLRKMSDINRTRERSPEEYEKQRETNLEKYGVSSYLSLVYQDGLEAINKKYDGSFLGSKEWKEKKDLYFEKMRKTNLEKYGVESVLSSREIQEKIQNTKRKNHTFRDSRQERDSIVLLKEKIREVYLQYGDPRYPFSCDIYLPKEDLFIELNYHWTHGTEPFIESKSQLEILEIWKEKAKGSKFYENAIQVWTERDTLKRVTATENNLNFLSFYSFEEFKEYVESIKEENNFYPYFDLEYSEDPSIERFKKLLKSYKSYNSKAKYNDLLLPFIWKIFYKKEISLWEDESIRRRLIQNRVSYLHKKEEDLTHSDILKGFSRSLIHKGFSSFSPMIIKSFIRDYKIKSIYDPCGGWGHRLLGAWDIEYWYNDFNPELVDQIRNIHSFYNEVIPSSKKYFSCNDAASFIPDRKFDAVFTCPPYYDTEDYSFDGDSSKLVESYKEWLENWWGNLVKNSKSIAPIFAFVISRKFLGDMSILLIREGFEEIQNIQVSENRKNHLSTNAEEFLSIWRIKE